ncbi:glycerate kinase, partial [Candidatus Blastococcus massiliensis]|uniref:glycerate kinase n=1 Tax=Candidatus Blastococcus massiliensis TaxID=1470358 RepID=UPI00058CF891
GFGLALWGAELASGAAAVGDAAGLPRLADDADVVVTGEGRFDDQTAAGKAPSHLLSLARERDLPVLLVAGSATTSTAAFAGAVTLVGLAGSVEAALAEPERWLRRAGAELARTLAR